MDQNEKSLPPLPTRSPSRPTYLRYDEQAHLDSRNDHALGSTRPTRPVHATTYPGPSNSPTSIAQSDGSRSTAVLPPKPKNVGEIIYSPTSTRKPISRKPVERRTISENLHAINTSFPARSNSERELNTGQLTPPPQSAIPLQESPTTNMLFNQASRSLSSLTQGINGVNIQDNTELPPPYTDSPTNREPRGDVKRRPTLGELSLNGEPPDAIQLVRENRLDLLQRMLDEGIGMNDTDPTTQRTAIMEAANLRRIGAARILIRSGPRLHLKDVNGWSALHFASSSGDVEICRLLLDAGAQLEEYSLVGDTPILLAARGGHTEAVQCLLNSWASQMSSGNSLLNGFLEAAKSGNVRTAELFVERGINPKKIEDSWRSVIYAAQSGSIPMMDFMLAHKCNLKQRDPEGRTALHFAAVLGHTAMVEKLLALKLSWTTQTKQGQETALHYATLAKQSAAAMALILHKNANITMRDADGIQAVHHSTRNGDAVLTTTLLNRGAKVDDQTKFGWTPMLLACAYGHLPLVAEFITRGVSLEEKLASPSLSPKGKTNEAARRGYWAEIRWPHAGARPLHIALEFSQDEVANTLIAAGAKLEEGDSEGWKPLHYAAFNARPHMVEMLLNRGVSPHTTTAMGNTPLSLGFRDSGMVATYEEKLQVHELLRAAMNAHKKSKLRQFSDAMTGPLNKSKEVGNRNKIWHTAQLADALYQSGPQLEVEGVRDEPLTATPSQQNIEYFDDNDSGYGDSRSSEPPLRITKTLTD